MINKKLFLLFYLLSLLIISSCNYKDDKKQTKYLNYPFENGKSNIKINCDFDEDCKIVNISGWGCGGPKAINKSNSKASWKSYNKKAWEIEKELGFFYDCINPDLNIGLKPICNDNKICELKK